MFTGLVTTVGRIAWVRSVPHGARYRIACPHLERPIRNGDSVAINGVCQTVVAHDATSITVEAIAATVEKTTLKGVRGGEFVNMERALPLGERLDGHLVQGHVHGTAAVSRIVRLGFGHRVTVSCEHAAAIGIVAEGSVALDGVSLTVSGVERDAFTVDVIPETWRRTITSRWGVGRHVNVEGDIVVRAAVAREDAMRGSAWHEGASGAGAPRGAAAHRATDPKRSTRLTGEQLSRWGYTTGGLRTRS